MSNPVIERYNDDMTSQGWGSNQQKNPEAKALGEEFEEQARQLWEAKAPAFCQRAAKTHCSTWSSQTSQKAADEGSGLEGFHQPLFFFQNNASEDTDRFEVIGRHFCLASY